MKRFHIHVAVTDIESSIDFYSKLFGQPPSKRHEDYAKWMLEDPRVNFAISSRGHAAGVDHLGFQADSPEELSEIKTLAANASDGSLLEQRSATCCYANSEKHWTIDPQGLAWEHFLTLSDAVEFGEDNQSGACCAPMRNSKTDSSAESACCIPVGTDESIGCCG